MTPQSGLDHRSGERESDIPTSSGERNVLSGRNEVTCTGSIRVMSERNAQETRRAVKPKKGIRKRIIRELL
jgi:hypothetical protein